MNIDKETLSQINRHEGEDLQGFLSLSHRSAVLKPKKGKGSFKRNKVTQRELEELMDNS